MITLGQQYVTCEIVNGTFQERIIPPPSGYAVFPKEYFALIDGASLHGSGSQNTC